MEAGQGRRPPPRLHRPSGYHPSGDCLRHRRVLVWGCARAATNIFGAPPTSWVRRWGGSAMLGPGAHGAGRQRLLYPVVGACPEMDVRYSITVRQRRSCGLIEAIVTDWTPIPYWLDGAAAVTETTYTFQSEPDAAPVRLIVRRVRPCPVPNCPLRHLQLSGCITDQLETLELEAPSATPHRERHPRPQVRCGAEPSSLGALRRQPGWPSK